MSPRIGCPPGDDSTCSVPPTAPRRSRMLTKPWPVRGDESASNPAPSSTHLEVRGASSSSTPRTIDLGVVAGVLAGVLHRLEAAEVHGRLDLRGVAATSVGVDRRQRAQPGRQRRAAPRPDRPTTAAAGRCRAPATAARRWRPARRRGLSSIIASASVGIVDQLLGQAQLHRHRDEVLLGAVVEVALELAALGVAGGDDARAGTPAVARWSAGARRATPAAPSRAGRCAARGRPGGRAR